MATAAAIGAFCSQRSRHHSPQHPRLELLGIDSDLKNDIDHWLQERLDSRQHSWIQVARGAWNFQALLQDDGKAG
ncbi:hypothetical protein PybrP1_001599 [[Pythium] brassicae (nom. inval.)]|nr:hypothetical protein PybrP1_001599 [[Pythium] brassicae (nom. inval.)]